MFTYLNNPPQEHRQLIAVHGGEKPVAVIHERAVSMLTMSRSSLESCLIGYALIGWSGAIPKNCEQTLITLPRDYTTWIFNRKRSKNG